VERSQHVLPCIKESVKAIVFLKIISKTEYFYFSSSTTSTPAALGWCRLCYTAVLKDFGWIESPVWHASTQRLPLLLKKQ